MRIIPFPGRDDVGPAMGPDEHWLSELEASLNGTREGQGADSWRQLRDDVRALAPPMTPEFEQKLRARIAGRGTRSAVGPPRRPKQPERPTGRSEERHRSRRPHRRLGRLRPTPPTLAALSVTFAMIAAVLIAAPWRPAGHTVETSPKSSSLAARADRLGPAFGPAESASATGAGAAKASSNSAGAGASVSAGAARNASPATATNAPVFSGASAAPGRVQQLGASITLTATPGEVQTVADRVSRLAVSDGGFVQSSHVQVQQTGTSEAGLDLSLPSTKLSAALASLGQIAPVRAESQSLQDITNTYDAARQRLADATAERQALLRALSKASTEGQIDSLHERIAQNRGAIASAQSALQTVSQHASTAEVEVTVTGDGHTASEGLTLHRGLHDAGRVLVVTLAILLIAAAILVPLVLLLAALVTARRMWRRYQRERVLDARPSR